MARRSTKRSRPATNRSLHQRKLNVLLGATLGSAHMGQDTGKDDGRARSCAL